MFRVIVFLRNSTDVVNTVKLSQYEKIRNYKVFHKFLEKIYMHREVAKINNFI